MAQNIVLAWEGTEYDHNPKSADWYWSLGIVGVAGTIAAVLFGNYLFALLILVAIGATILHAAKVPPVHQFKLVEQGIVVGNDLHPFERMTSFSVLEDVEGKLAPMISIKTESWLSPHLIIPLRKEDADVVYSYFLRHVNEEEHQHTFSDLVARWLGF